MFQPIPDEIDIMSPDAPVLLVEDSRGTHYTGQSGGNSCNHPTATGVVVNLRRAGLLQTFLDGEFHARWCGCLDSAALTALSYALAQLEIPLHIDTFAWADEGWVPVTVLPFLPPDWEYLAPHAGKKAILIWNNCD